MTESEIREDFQRFIRHEAMRANCSQERIIDTLGIPSELITLKK